MEDRQIQALVQEELDWDPSIDASDIGVSVDKSIVRLTGRVANYGQKIAAEAAVKRVKGVRGYVEDLEVRTAPLSFSDEAMCGRAVNVLDWDVAVPTGSVTPKVENGYVTLTGKVDWGYQRTAAERAVRGLQGVRGVLNQIIVKPRVQPADIKRRIESALKRQANLEASKITVTVDGSKVRLEGKVKAWFERDTAERAAWAAPGVTAVEDRVTIGG